MNALHLNTNKSTDLVFLKKLLPFARISYFWKQ